MQDKRGNEELYRLIYTIDGAVSFVQLVPKGARLTGLFRPSMPYSTFDGWGEVPARMPGSDLILEGHFTKDIYRVIFASGVEQYGVVSLPAGATVAPPPAPKREGYSFVGWEGFDGVMPAENRTYEAQFVPLSYTVTYVVDDTYRFRLQCAYGSPIPRLAAPRKENYAFSGWSEIPEVMPSHDVTIVGTFEEKRYKLTRIVDGVVFSEEHLPFGAEIDKKVKPVQEGYYFSGWRKLPDTMPAGDVEVVASMYPARYRVDFFINDQPVNSIYVPFGEVIPTEKVAEVQGQLFAGWDDLPATMPSHDIAVHGTISSILYRLSFVVDDNEIARFDLTEGEAIPADVEVPSKPGYAFCGWQELPDEMPPRDLTLHGVYAAVSTRYVFVIDGEVYDEITPAAGEDIKLPTPPEKNGKPFAGWNEPEVDPRTGAIIYIGSYTASDFYTITYMVEDEVVGTQELKAGETPIPPAVEENDAFAVLGWRDLPSRMPPCDIVVSAETKRLKYTLEFMVDDEVVYEMALDAGQEIACPAPAPREGFVFDGWQDVPAVMPETDLVVRGSYSTRVHTVTYMMEGRSVFTAKMKYGDHLVPPDVPAEKPNGHTFVGWSPILKTMPDEDVVIEGAYSDTVCVMDIYVDGIRRDVVRARVGTTPRLPSYSTKEGMHFVWQDAPAVVPQGRIDVHGGYVKNTHVVTYLSGDTVIGEERYSYGASLTPQVRVPNEKQKTFLGWRDQPETMPNHDISLQAMYADRLCHLTFRLDGRLFTEMDVPVGAPTPNPEVPVREGYKFDGWRNYVAVMPPYNFTAYGTYSRKTFRVTYLVGDEVFEEQDYVSGAPIVAPAAPAKEYFAFREWVGLGTHMPAHDMTVSARYSGETFRISYVVDGVLAHTAEYEFGERVTPFVPPARDGLTFSGWDNEFKFMPAREVIVTGKFEQRIFTVTYKVGGMIYRIDRYEAGAHVTPPAPPERNHETFVRWKNFTSVMPDYDFVCAAEYSEVVSHYSFVLDGEILKEGQSRKGEILTPPEAPHRSGFAFSGWEGFTGIMPASDVVFIGSYASDKFKIQYYLDDVFYCESGFDEGERVVPADPPEMEGFHFCGWKGLPNVMPSDDVIVRGTMKAQIFRLIYRTDGKTVVYDNEVPCGIPLGKIKAPERFGFEFGGWNDEPAVMPAHPMTVNGVYHFTDEKFDILTLQENMSHAEGAIVQKAPPKEPFSLIFICGDCIRAVVDGICYPIPVPADKVCLRNGRVVDEAGLTVALRRIWRKYRLPKKVAIVMADTHAPDVFYDHPTGKPMLDESAMRALWHDSDRFGTAEYRVLRLSRTPDMTRYMISRTHKETNETLAAIFKSFGVTVTSTRTMTGALAAYLQPNKRMERRKNQMCFFYLPNAVTGVLMLDGQIVAVMQNHYPFEGRDWDVKAITEGMVDKLVIEAHRLGAVTPLSMIAVGGIDRTHARTAEKVIGKMVKASVERTVGDTIGGLFGGVHRWKKPSVVRLGFGHAENRTK